MLHTCRMVFPLLFVILFSSTGAAIAQDSNAAKYPPGLVVTSITKGSPAEQAGLKVGDLVLSFDGNPVRFESQIGPCRDKARWDGKKAIELAIRRGSDNLTLNLALAPILGMAVQPPLPPAAQSLYDDATALPKAQAAAALAKLHAAARAAVSLGDHRAAARLWRQVYNQTADGSNEELEALNAVLRSAEMAGDELLVVSSLTSLGQVAEDRGKLDEAEAYFKRDLAITERLAPNSIALADTLDNLGNVTEDRGKLDDAEGLYKDALAIRERLAPGTLGVAGTLNNLGIVAKDRGNLDVAEPFYKRALAIKERLAPDSLDLATTLNNVGLVARDRGKLNEAEEYLTRALAIRERLAPDSLDLAGTFNNLGLVARDRGKLNDAEEYLTRALAIYERLAPDSLGLATTLNNLGDIAWHRGKLEEADAFLDRTLAIRERLAPNSLDVATSLNYLGLVANDRGKLDEAEAYYKRTLTIQERLAPDSIDLAWTFNDLGNVAVERGKLDEAEALYERVLAKTARLSPDSLNVALALNNLGAVAGDRGKLDEADAYNKRALAITGRLAPNSLEMAASLNNMGTVLNDRGKLDEAEEQHTKAWRIVKLQGMQVAGDSGRQEFGAAYGHYAVDLLATQLKRNEAARALVTLEEGRAQALVAEMAEHGITEKVTPPEVWRAYHKAETAHNVAYKDAERAYEPVYKAEALLASYKQREVDDATMQEKQRAVDAAEKLYRPKHSEEIRTRYEMESCWADVLRSAKAAIPVPVDPNEARKRLTPGTLLLEFSVADKEITLFAVSVDGVKACNLPAKRKELEATVKAIRGYVARDVGDRGPTLEFNSDIENDALRSLFKKLFPPEVQNAIQAARHIVISPDDFLWDLPFAALVTNASGAPTYLGLQKPLSYTQSLTVLLTPGTAGSARGTGTLVIGNPVYDIGRRNDLIAFANSIRNRASGAHSAAKPKSGVKLASARRDGELGVMTRDGSAPQQLPYAEQEAKQVAGLYHIAAHTGIEPEAWFRQHARDAKVIHLATHGRLNTHLPESSGVLLAVPEKAPPVGQYDNDGALQAWEVWLMKLKADLVVLSACETGRGTKVTGEGLIGLTRAFQYAGAKTIVSSQWKVNDQSTASLMTSFHRHLLAGVERDEALRLAMCDVARSKTPGWSEPYHWAAFVMVGETGKMPK